MGARPSCSNARKSLIARIMAKVRDRGAGKPATNYSRHLLPIIDFCAKARHPPGRDLEVLPTKQCRYVVYISKDPFRSGPQFFPALGSDGIAKLPGPFLRRPVPPRAFVLSDTPPDSRNIWQGGLLSELLLRRCEPFQCQGRLLHLPTCEETPVTHRRRKTRPRFRSNASLLHRTYKDRSPQFQPPRRTGAPRRLRGLLECRTSVPQAMSSEPCCRKASPPPTQ